MHHHPKNRLSYILAVTAAVCAAGCGGCQQEQPVSVPPLGGENATPPAAAPVSSPEATPVEAPKTPAADKPVEAAPAKAAETAPAKAPEAAPAEAPAKPADKAPEKVEPKTAEAVKEEAAPKPATGTKPAEAAKNTNDLARQDFKANGAAAPDVAKDLAKQLAAFEIPAHYGTNHGELIVMVEAPINESDVPVDTQEVRNQIRAVLTESNSKLKPAVTLQGTKRATARIRAIHLGFEPESRALGLIPTTNPNDAPDIMVNTTVTKEGEQIKLTVYAKETRNGKPVWVGSKYLNSPSVVVAPVKPAEEAKPAPEAKASEAKTADTEAKAPEAKADEGSM